MFHRNAFRGFGAPGVEIWTFPLLWLFAFTTACTTVQAAIPNIIKIEETFCGRMDVQTGGRTFETGFIRSTQRSRPKKYHTLFQRPPSCTK